MLFGSLGAFIRFAFRRASAPETAPDSYYELRRNLGRSSFWGLRS